MKLLIITQKVDKNDPVLGFFHGWISEFALRFSSIKVIALMKGVAELPVNVSVYSLGKENKVSKIKYIINFYKYIWQFRNDYDAIFVHMNQEYLLMAGWIWKIMGKKVYMWRNHHAGNILTDISAFFCDNVFCTSKFSYTAKYKKTILMPVGIDTKLFKVKDGLNRKENSALFLGRIAPVKRPDLLIRAMIELSGENIKYQTSIYGDALPQDKDYLDFIKQKVKQKGLDKDIIFYSGIPNTATVDVYNGHELFINLSTSGMYDKTIFEAMACGCLVLASNKNLLGLIPDRYVFIEGDLLDLKRKLMMISKLSAEQKDLDIKSFQDLVQNNSLANLGLKLYQIIK